MADCWSSLSHSPSLSRSLCVLFIRVALFSFSISRNTLEHKKGHELNGRSKNIYDKIGANVLALKMKVEYVNRLFIQHDYSFRFFLIIISLFFFALRFSCFALEWIWTVMKVKWCGGTTNTTENFYGFEWYSDLWLFDCYNIVLIALFVESCTRRCCEHSMHDRCTNFRCNL